MELVELIAALFSIIGGSYLFFKWVKNQSWNKKPTSIFLKENNIYLVYSDSSTKQITFHQSDFMPVLGKSLIIFFRGELGNGSTVTFPYKLMGIHFNALNEFVIADQKPFADGLNNSFEILRPSQLCLSEDQKTAFFVIEKYATGSELVQVDIRTGKWKELFSVEHFEILYKSKYRNNLLVAVSEIRDRGRDIYYKICDINGKTLLEFEDYNNYMIFRSRLSSE